MWSLGEANDAYNNKAEIDAAMRKIGGTAMYTGYHWTSTQYSNTYAWELDWNDGSMNGYNKDYGNYVRAVCAI